MTAVLDREVHKLWREGKRVEAIRVQERVVRMKEIRGDEDLAQFREELDALRAGDFNAYPESNPDKLVAGPHVGQDVVK